MLRNLPKKKVKSFSISLSSLVVVFVVVQHRLTALVSDITRRDHAWAQPDGVAKTNK